jgi:hypothetical protein
MTNKNSKFIGKREREKVTLRGGAFEPNCKSCCSIHRDDIYKMYVELEMPGTHIQRELKKRGEDITVNAVNRHCRKHIGPRNEVILRRSSRPEAIYADIEKGKFEKVQVKDFLERVVAVGMRHAPDAKLRDALTASKQLTELNKQEKEDFMDRITKSIVAGSNIGYRVTKTETTIQPNKVIDITSKDGKESSEEKDNKVPVSSGDDSVGGVFMQR